MPCCVLDTPGVPNGQGPGAIPSLLTKGLAEEVRTTQDVLEIKGAPRGRRRKLHTVPVLMYLLEVDEEIEVGVELYELMADDAVPLFDMAGMNTEVVVDHSKGIHACIGTGIDTHEHMRCVYVVHEVRAAALPLLAGGQLVGALCDAKLQATAQVRLDLPGGVLERGVQYRET